MSRAFFVVSRHCEERSNLCEGQFATNSAEIASFLATTFIFTSNPYTPHDWQKPVYFSTAR
jgi:hypothetical protein